MDDICCINSGNLFLTIYLIKFKDIPFGEILNLSVFKCCNIVRLLIKSSFVDSKLFNPSQLNKIIINNNKSAGNISQLN